MPEVPAINPLVLQAAKVLWKQRYFILIIVFLATAIGVAREILIPSGYVASSFLLVTSPNIGGDTGELLPANLNPKAYENLLMSDNVLGEVLSALIANGVYKRLDAPSLERFRKQFEINIAEVDKTARPVNYSPLIQLTASGVTKDIAVKAVDEWANIAKIVAGDVAKTGLIAVGEALQNQSNQYELKLEQIWVDIEKEKSEWNLDVLERKIDVRVSLLNTLEEKRLSITRNVAIAQQKLLFIRDDVAKEALGELELYINNAKKLSTELEQEAGEWNTDIMEREMTALLTLMNDLRTKLTDAVKKQAAQEQRLESIRENIASEEPYLLLARAPDEAAYWIISETNSDEITPRDISGQVMVSQQLNDVYWTSRREEQIILAELAGLAAEIESIELQYNDLYKTRDKLTLMLAQHKNTQDTLRLQINMEENRYSKLGQGEILALRSQERETMIELAGLEAELDATELHINLLGVELENLQATLAKHDIIQKRLKKQEEVAMLLYSDIRRSDSFSMAATALASAQDQFSNNTIGLNQITNNAHAIEDRGLLGRKGRVLILAMLSFMLTAGAVVFAEIGLPKVKHHLQTEPNSRIPSDA